MNDSKRSEHGDDPVTLAAEGFRKAYGRDPEGVWSAPGRVNLIGEHTDYNDGYALPFAIDRRTAVAVARRDDRLFRAASTISQEVAEAELEQLGSARGWSAYPFGVAWVLARSTGETAGETAAGISGADLFIAGGVPIGAGLSSSAAIECATALALDELWGTGLDRPALAALCQRAENEVVGAPTGILDQSASLLGRAGCTVFLDFRNQVAEPIPFALDAAGLAVLVIDTGISHDHATGGYAARRASCERAAAVLGVPALRDSGMPELEAARDRLDDETFRRARHIITENQRVLDTVALLRSEPPASIGPLLDASHRSMRDDFEISVPELDTAVEAARAAGALGARMTGGGFGGSAIALVPAGRSQSIADAVRTAFTGKGYAAPEIFTVVADEGARRES